MLFSWLDFTLKNNPSFELWNVRLQCRMLTIWCSMLFDDVMVSGILADAVMYALTCILSANDRNRFSSSFFSLSHPFWLIITEKCLSNSILNFIMTEWWVQRNNGDYFIWSIFSFVCPISIPFGSIRMNLFLSSIMIFFFCGEAAKFNDALLLLTRICMRQRTVRIILNYFCIHSFDVFRLFFFSVGDLHFVFFSPVFRLFFFPISVCCCFFHKFRFWFRCALMFRKYVEIIHIGTFVHFVGVLFIFIRLLLVVSVLHSIISERWKKNQSPNPWWHCLNWMEEYFVNFFMQPYSLNLHYNWFNINC